jgi:EAL domain-containing protein (putative c-di-GMP-specific phosphodiesterase class I)
MDDEPDVGAYVADAGRDLGFEVEVLSHPNQFAASLEAFAPTVIVLDLQMPDQDGVELLRVLAERSCAAKVVLTGTLDSRVLTATEQLGMSMGVDIAGSLVKPITLDRLEVLLVKLRLEERRFTTQQLSEAIDAGQLVVHYQPKAVMKAPGQWLIDGAEALVRWQHDEYGLIYPGEFIGLAEESGLIIGVTDFVFRAAMEQARVWVSNGLRLELALNLSAQFLRDLEFPDRLLTLIRENELDPSMVTLELTETAAMQNPELTMDILARLRLKNVNLSLDDFGTGFSSLTQLYHMPFSELKIDTSFVADIGTNEDARAMVEGLIYLAHKLKMKTCAEGVEDEVTLRLLEQMRCDKAQGHVLGSAVRPKELESLIERRNEGAAQRERPVAATGSAPVP